MNINIKIHIPDYSNIALIVVIQTSIIVILTTATIIIMMYFQFVFVFYLSASNLDKKLNDFYSFIELNFIL